MFECYYGSHLAWPKDTCNDEVKFMEKFTEHPLKFTCEDRRQPVMRMKSPNADTCAENIEALVALSSIKTTTTTTTTITETTTTTTTILCDAGSYLDVEAKGCIDCPSGQYQTDNNHRHTACNAHLACGKDEFLAEKGTSTTPNVCTSHSECGDTEYESLAPVAGSTNRECTEVINCKPGEYELTVPTATSNRVCDNCDPSLFYWSDGENQMDCSTFDLCTANEKVSVKGTAISDLECEACAPGYYQDQAAHRLDECKQTTTTTTISTTTTTTGTWTSTSETTTTTSETTTTTSVSTTTTTSITETSTTSKKTLYSFLLWHDTLITAPVFRLIVM